MDNIKKYFNKYTYLLFGLIVLIFIGIFIIVPNFQREEFSQDVIDDIIEGVTTTSSPNSSENNNEGSQKEEPNNLTVQDNLEIYILKLNSLPVFFLLTKNFNIIELTRITARAIGKPTKSPV